MPPKKKRAVVLNRVRRGPPRGNNAVANVPAAVDVVPARRSARRQPNANNPQNLQNPQINDAELVDINEQLHSTSGEIAGNSNTPVSAQHVQNLLDESRSDMQAKFDSFQTTILNKIADLFPDKTSQSDSQNNVIDNDASSANGTNAGQNRNNTDVNLSSSSSQNNAAAGGRVTLNNPTDVDLAGSRSRYAPSAAAVHEGDRSMTIDTDLIAKSLNQMLGKSTPSIGLPFANSNMLVAGSFLSIKIKNAIKAGEYVELGLMDAKVETTSRAGVSATTATISLTPTRTRKAKDETEWLRWFCTFASVYTGAYPDSAPEIFTYISKILHFFAKYSFQEVRNYDEQFRWAKSQVPTMHWHKTEHDILEAVTEGRVGESVVLTNKKNPLGKRRQFGANAGTIAGGQRKQYSGLYCYDFNNMDAVCTRKPCPYEHVCANCRANHPKFRCAQNATTTMQSTQPKHNPQGQQKSKQGQNPSRFVKLG